VFLDGTLLYNRRMIENKRLRVVALCIAIASLCGIVLLIIAAEKRNDRLSAKIASLDEIIQTQNHALDEARNDIDFLKMELDSTKTEYGSQNTKLASELEAERKRREQSESTIMTQLSKEAASLKRFDLAGTVQAWRPRIAYIKCTFETSTRTYTQSGSGLFIGKINATDYHIQTNKHVLWSDSAQSLPTSCSVKLPDDVSVNANEAVINKNGKDAGILVVKSPTEKMKNFSSNILGKACTAQANVGDEIIVLGYPSIGVSGDVTVTEGIISGSENDFYVTSAKIEQGNSGGAAILLKDNCYLGIPTFVQVGRIEALARILKWTAIR
jgi:S1-C subfamily serine protease